MMLGTMTVFVRLHYSYQAEMNSGDVSHNDDSICKITLLIKTGGNSGDVGHNYSICKITLLI